MRKTLATIAFALLWAPATEGFVGQSPVTPVVSTMFSAAVGSANDSFDQEAFDRKNASRKKFGLKPVTPEEFIALEAQVQQMALEQEQRAAVLKKEAAAKRTMNQAKAQTPIPGFLDKMFGNVLPDTCESNFDCEAPKVCCDFGVSKVCCSGGSKLRSREGELALVPVPVDVTTPYNKY